MVSKQVVTMANCIVGVSVLAMPFCFKQCGVVLASILLLLSGVMTRTVCYFLLKASTITRRRTYELLAYHTYGQAGKLTVEISIIGFLIGTLIAFLVVMGDLGPEIISDVFSVENNSSLRCIIMTALSLFVALPLGLLRNLDSLTGVSTVTMLFYVFLVCKIFSEGMGPLWSGSFLTRIDYWRPAGVLQCIPIFSMALSCQTQIFGIYDSLPEPSLGKMNEIVKNAINVCTIFYISVGFLGYIAFCTANFGGNILLSFGPTGSTQLIKLCFVLSIAFSFPLVIFPCRASLHSLIFKRTHHHIHDISSNHIPESRLKILTVGIIIFTLIVGLLIPNIELVLGLVGSTTGSVICIIFPAAMFIQVTSKNTTERLLAQILVGVGIVIMIVTTYATLYAVEQAQANPNNMPPPVRGFEQNNFISITEPNMKIKLLEDQDKERVEKIDKIIEPALPNLDSNNVLPKKAEFVKLKPSGVSPSYLNSSSFKKIDTVQDKEVLKKQPEPDVVGGDLQLRQRSDIDINLRQRKPEAPLPPVPEPEPEPEPGLKNVDVSNNEIKLAVEQKISDSLSQRLAAPLPVPVKNDIDFKVKSKKIEAEPKARDLSAQNDVNAKILKEDFVQSKNKQEPLHSDNDNNLEFDNRNQINPYVVAAAGGGVGGSVNVENTNKIIERDLKDGINGLNQTKHMTNNQHPPPAPAPFSDSAVNKIDLGQQKYASSLSSPIPPVPVPVPNDGNAVNKAEILSKLNAEEVLKQLNKHHEEQKKVLAEQKEILAKLKQHQVDDELSQKRQLLQKNKDKDNNIQEKTVFKDKENIIRSGSDAGTGTGAKVGLVGHGDVQPISVAASSSTSTSTAKPVTVRVREP